MSPKVFAFHDPWLLLLAVPALAFLYMRVRRRRSAAAILFPSVARLRGLRPTLRQRARILLPMLQALALLGLVAAAARPRQGDARTVIRREGIAIQMVLDRSYSMVQQMRSGGTDRRRIDIVKDAFVDFVAGSKALPGRKTDLIGLTTFARFTEENCPLVPQHEPLITAVQNLTTVAPVLDRYNQPVWPTEAQLQQAQKHNYKQNPLNATAIGDGLQRAVLSLITAEEDLARGEDDGGYKIKGKAIILLTDGENNAGEIDPVEAGRYAHANGIRIYYILFREQTETQQTIFGRKVVRELDPDELLEEPRRVVEPSGGKAFLARSGEELLEIYEDIDKLERSDIGRTEYRSYQEKFHWFLIPGIACALLCVFLGETLFRSIP
jgi:Ca-activated chloride channel family protein